MKDKYEDSGLFDLQELVVQQTGIASATPAAAAVPPRERTSANTLPVSLEALEASSVGLKGRLRAGASEFPLLSNLALELDDEREMPPTDYQALLVNLDKKLGRAIEVWEARLERARRLVAFHKLLEKAVLAGMVVCAGLTMSPDLLGAFTHSTTRTIAAVTGLGAVLCAAVVAVDPFAKTRMFAQRLERIAIVGGEFRRQLLGHPPVRQLKNITVLMLFAHDLLCPHRES